jgi:hypothetical protein
MGQLETIFMYSRKIESILTEKLGATDTGLHEKTIQLHEYLSERTTRELRFITAIRNKMMQTEVILPETTFDKYIRMCEHVLSELNLLIDQRPQLAQLSKAQSNLETQLTPAYTTSTRSLLKTWKSVFSYLSKAVYYALLLWSIFSLYVIITLVENLGFRTSISASDSIVIIAPFLLFSCMEVRRRMAITKKCNKW